MKSLISCCLLILAPFIFAPAQDLKSYPELPFEKIIEELSKEDAQQLKTTRDDKAASGVLRTLSAKLEQKLKGKKCTLKFISAGESKALDGLALNSSRKERRMVIHGMPWHVRVQALVGKGDPEKLKDSRAGKRVYVSGPITDVTIFRADFLGFRDGSIMGTNLYLMEVTLTAEDFGKQ